MSYVSVPGGGDRTPGMKFLIMMLAGFMLSIPILSIYLLNYDRQSRSDEARASIADGWGGAQKISGPKLSIPYVPKAGAATEKLVIEPELAKMNTHLTPEKRKRAIYESVVFTAKHGGAARFVLPDDLAQRGIPVAALQFAKAELDFGVSDMVGMQGGLPSVSVNGKALKLRPGAGPVGAGFHAEFDATAINSGKIATRFDYIVRGNGMLTMRPDGSDTSWTVTSSWKSPSYKGMLPTFRKTDKDGFKAIWRVGGLSLGAQSSGEPEYVEGRVASAKTPVNAGEARVDLFEPVDIYSQVDRATKYGFLFIGFTFVAFLMFDVIGGVRVSLIEYLLVGAGLVMFFVLLLALAEVTGFAISYILSSAAVIGLITAYSAAVLKSWSRAKWIGGLLSGLYASLYVLLSLEDFALLIGALMLFAALAAVMYLTRNIEWGGKRELEGATA